MLGCPILSRARVLVGALCLLAASPAAAQVKLHALFTHGMVLQQGMKVPVWGTAADGEKVTVGIQDQTVSTVASDGKWRVDLQPLRPGGPFELAVSGSRNLSVRNVLVGEVWICGGQSNMQWSVIKTSNPADVLADANNPKIRMFTVPRQAAEEPQTEVASSWTYCVSSSVMMFSAVGYFFGRDLQGHLDVPVGLISANCVGTPAEAWMSQQALADEPELKYLVEDNFFRVSPTGRVDPKSPTGLYNGMIHPLIPYAIRGVIWYQGESNTREGYQYQTMFPALIKSWRKAWGQGDFPFLFVQLAPYRPFVSMPSQSLWAELREAQLQTLKTVPNTAMAVTTDVGDQRDMHPRQKEPVAARLLLAARALAYGEDIDYSGPIYSSFEVRGDRIHVHFDHVGGGLVAKGGPLTGFSIAGEDHKFVKADAEIEEDHLIVSSPKVGQPVAVRYGWADFPVLNLWNKADLPASPFRTDSFPMLSEPEG